MICSVNPTVGKEKEFASGMATAAKKKRVLVIGGGPGGMQAAVTAAQRGHDVTIWEKESRLGGQINLAAIPPGKDRLHCLTEYLMHQIDGSKIDVELQKETSESLIKDFAPDSIVVAVGAKPRIPEIKGQEKKKPIYFSDVLLGRVSVGSKIAIVGGGYIGCEVADFLLSRGGQVWIRTSMAQIADDVFYPYGNLIRERLNRNGVQSIPNVVDEQIETDGLRVTDKEGKQVLIEADDIVLCTGFESDRSLSNTLSREQFQVFEVGDCVHPRRIYEAVSEGAQAGLQI
jgi:pyruvate/2-oxoglutarate dehydrogenase complex dihydrolipoamide dehydrogenase (E3) component